MIQYTIVFAFVAIVSAVLGFGGVSTGSPIVARVCCCVFSLLTIVSLFAGRRGRPFGQG